MNVPRSPVLPMSPSSQSKTDPAWANAAAHQIFGFSEWHSADDDDGHAQNDSLRTSVIQR